RPADQLRPGDGWDGRRNHHADTRSRRGWQRGHGHLRPHRPHRDGRTAPRRVRRALPGLPALLAGGDHRRPGEGCLVIHNGHEAKPSPRIIDISWGHMEVAGLGSGKDFKLYPGGGREWDWSETGTRHVPGIQVADVEELLAHGARVVVLSLGM